MDTLYKGEVESSCAYWVPLEDWRGKTAYLKARGVDYIARLPGCENPVGWYGQLPHEERGRIDLMIELDNWRWMPIN
jgi:hypothetical protein